MPNIVTVPAVGAFDPTDITLTDNTSGAFLVKEGSNEYMRINTTNGSELTQFKMPFTTGGFKYIQETSAGPFEFIKGDSTSVRLFPGSTGSGFSFNHITVSTTGVQLQGGAELRIGSSLPVSGSGARAYIQTSGHSWTELLAANTTSKIQRVSDGVKMLEVDTDCNATFTLADSSAGVFKVENPNESYDYLNINEANNRITIQTGATTGDYIILKAGGYETLQIQGNTNVTFTLNTASSANFKVVGGSVNFIDVETAPSSEKTKFLVPKTASNEQFVFGSPDHEYLKLGHHSSSPLGASFNFTSQGGTNVNFGYNAHDPGGVEFKTATNRHCDVRLESGASFHVKDPNTNIFTVDQDTNVTFTLDNATSPVFKVVDDNSSPRTYITVTAAGATEFGNAVGTNTFRGSTITSISANLSFRNASSAQLAAFNSDYFIQNGGGGFKGQSIYGTPVTTTSTGTVTVTDQLLKQGRVFFYDSSGSGTATITVQYKTDGTFYEDGTSFAERYVTIHNKDSTHNVTYKFEPVTNEGTDFPALGSTDTVADDLLDGTGVTLTPGQTAIFKVITYAINSTHSNHKHYWTTIAKG